MPPPNLSKLDAPLGPPRDWFAVDISTNDYENEAGFYALINMDGTPTYQTLAGSADQTPSAALTAGDWIGPKTDHPGLLKAVRSNATIQSITVVIV